MLVGLLMASVHKLIIANPAPRARHILTYAESLGGGGVERVMLRLAARWLDAGRRVTMVLGRLDGPSAAELPAGIELVVLDTNMIGAHRSLPAIVAARRPDVIFCPGNHYTSMAVWTRLRLGAACPPIVAKVSNTLIRRDHALPIRPAYRAWLRMHPAHIDHFVAMTPAMHAETVAMMGAAADTVSVIANPPTLRMLQGALADAPAAPMMVGVGRLEPQKRWDRLIDAMPRLSDRNARLTIVGEGSDRPRLEAQVAALGLHERVLMPGFVADPAPLVAKASVAVLTSDFEGVPGALREALELGTPVVSTESSVAVREIVSSPSQGSIVPVGDARALIAALDHWLEPGRPRPTPVAPVGVDAANAYLDLFDDLAGRRIRV